MSSIDDNIDIDITAEQKDIILNNLDENGRLTCLKGFKVAKLLKVEPNMISAIAKNMNIKVSNCELGVFGKIEFEKPNEEILFSIKQKYPNIQIECKDLWIEAKSSSLRAVGSVAKNSDIEVINCQLGCFRLRKGHNKN